LHVGENLAHICQSLFVKHQIFEHKRTAGDYFYLKLRVDQWSTSARPVVEAKIVSFIVKKRTFILNTFLASVFLMTSDEVLKIDFELLQISKNKLLELMESVLATDQRVRERGGLPQSELTKQVAFLYYKERNYAPLELNPNVEQTLLQRIKRALNNHPEKFESVRGRMERADGAQIEVKLWRLRQILHEQDNQVLRFSSSSSSSKRKGEREKEKTKKQLAKKWFFPYVEEFPEIGAILENLPHTLDPETAQEIKKNVDATLRIKRTPLNLESWSYVRKELLVRKMAFALINSKIANHSESGSEGQANNNSRIRQYTNKLVSLLKS
jgi:hypothetical protein